MNSKLFIDKIKDFNDYPFCIQAVLIKCKNCYLKIKNMIYY